VLLWSGTTEEAHHAHDGKIMIVSWLKACWRFC
jgi:hypothetical protein